MPNNFVHANLETRHYSFDVYAANRQDAEVLLRAAWSKHARQTGAGDFEEFASAVVYTETHLGEALRDHEPMVLASSDISAALKQVRKGVPHG
jgi:hypothetical protein